MIRIARKYADEPDIAFHELMRRVLGRPGFASSLTFGTLNSGLAMYFACSYSGNPVYANTTDMRVDLQQHKRLDVSLPRDWDESYDVGKNWATVFWAFRQTLGSSTTDRLLAKIWSTWQPPDKDEEVFPAFGRALVEADRSNAVSIRRALETRGLKMH